MARVTYECDGGVATVMLDDGKVNALSPDMQSEINQALDKAEADGAVVLLTGNQKALSAGFDLSIISTPGPESVAMLRGGFELSCRLLSFPTPVVIATSGHAIAMGFFLLLSGDYRIGVDKPVKLVANEVAIGMTLPWAAIEITRHRLTPSAFQRMVNTAEPIAPSEAIAAGVLDAVVPEAELMNAAHEVATRFTTLNMDAHRGTKARVREQMLGAIRAANDSEFPAP
ncbi:MAG TPA: crotonase/enoyl-CoA hydratase family protein [Acidimicrobiales bacterium]|nr:crotonase/enoyl-CoA hydratase family protein [Acidimicrobiales bacterium]